VAHAGTFWEDSFWRIHQEIVDLMVKKSVTALETAISLQTLISSSVRKADAKSFGFETDLSK